MKYGKMQYEVLQWASLFLEKNNREQHFAQLLLQHYLNVNRSTFFMRMREEVPSTIIQKFVAGVKEHAKTGKPLQHITGYDMFYGRKFYVNEHVLIPRPETEELMEHVIKKVNQLNLQKPSIIDIGTGSGIIATTLALEMDNATVYATDISTESLQVAQRNASIHQANVSFLQGDFLQPILSRNIKADIIISNPPYISRAEMELLSDTVKNFDPELALFADENGLAAYRKIIASVPAVIKKPGILAFEIGHKQGEAVTHLIMEKLPTSRPVVLRDINGKDRMVMVTL